MSQESDSVNPAERLLARYGFTVLRPDPEIEGGMTGFGLAPLVRAGQPRIEPSLEPTFAAIAEVSDLSDMRDFVRPDWPNPHQIVFETQAEAEEHCLGQFKAFLLDAKRAGHDTFFIRAPYEVTSERDFATDKWWFKAYVRGRSWKAKAAA